MRLKSCSEVDTWPRSAQETRRTGLDHAGRRKQQKPPPPGLDHLGDRWRAGAPDCNLPGGSSRRTRCPPDWIIQGQVAADAPDWNIRGGSSSRSRRPPDWNTQGQEAEDAPDWIVRGRTRRSGHHPQDRINRGKEARRSAQDRPGWIKQEEPTPPGQVWKQHKGQLQGGAVTQGRERGRGEAVQQRCRGAGRKQTIQQSRE